MIATRRGLFQGLVNTANGLPFDSRELRPPGAIFGADFYAQCTRCKKCQDLCPENVITQGSGGFPKLDFSLSGCTGCSACMDVCPTGALSRTSNRWPAGNLNVSDACLPKLGVSCQSCKDACEWEAISFPMLSRLPSPVINEQVCLACGECVSLCPTDALSILPLQETKREIA